ncbi:MAG TPA: HEPN domain-containing protein [Dehalococcoidia bacterium]|jgi:HEPN domain-containing protein
MPPDPARLELVRGRLIKGRHDLLIADLASRNPELRDVAVYHCQQAAEKALKAYLV